MMRHVLLASLVISLALLASGRSDELSLDYPSSQQGGGHDLAKARPKETDGIGLIFICKVVNHLMYRYKSLERFRLPHVS